MRDIFGPAFGYHGPASSDGAENTLRIIREMFSEKSPLLNRATKAYRRRDGKQKRKRKSR